MHADLRTRTVLPFLALAAGCSSFDVARPSLDGEVEATRER
jgi:hypothetical protein